MLIIKVRVFKVYLFLLAKNKQLLFVRAKVYFVSGRNTSLGTFFIMSQTQPLFRLFLSFSQHNNKYSTHLTINAKSVDGVFGI